MFLAELLEVLFTLLFILLPTNYRFTH